MTQELIETLRILRDHASDEEDRAFLGAIIQADEAAQAEPTDEHLRAACGHVAPISQIDENGRCPGCVLIWMHEQFSIKRASAIRNGF